LILVAIAMVGIVTAIWGMLSGPMAEMGVREIVIKIFGMDIVQSEREGRIIILYHSIAMAVVAIETYMVTGLLKMKAFFKTAINSIITVGYILTMIFGMGFAYFGHNWAFHGVFIFGLSLIFFAGVLLIIALWPWNPEYYVTDKDYAHTKKGVDMERVAFFATAVTTVISPYSAPSLVHSMVMASRLSSPRTSSTARKTTMEYPSSVTCISCWH
jgi:hypothetical protein